MVGSAIHATLIAETRVNQTLENPAIRRRLPHVWEFFRAVSGLVAVVALLGIVAGTSRLAEFDGHPAVVAPAASDAKAAEPNKTAPATSPSLTAQQETVVFYLVATPEQEYNADWGENVDASDHWRKYRILFVRNDAELQAARHSIIDYMLAKGEATLVQLIDLRR